MLLPLLASSLGTYSLFAVACLSYLLSFLLPVTIPLLLAESSIRILFIKVLHGMLPWTLRRAACLRRASFFPSLLLPLLCPDLACRLCVLPSCIASRFAGRAEHAAP